MKTTIDIPDALFTEVRKLASREGTTMKAVIQEGIRRILSERKRGSRFHLRKATFKGDGLQPQIAGFPWERIREMTYEGRGG
jgi:Arc/MetJ family transcription regulator